MLYGPMDPNERFRARRDQTRRTKRRRRAAVLALLLVVVIAVAMGARFVGDASTIAPGVRANGAATPAVGVPSASARSERRPLPVEIRGVHVTGALASLPGKFREYIGYKRYGLNTIELDVKDEGGEIGFTPADVPLARTSGATRPYYNPKALVGLAHRNGVYMIGRVVCFQDPLLASARPDLAVQRSDGSVWTTSAGLGWVNPYDRRVWDYCASIAEAAAKAGFDQIMFDYVRFPSDGDVGAAVYPGRTSVSKGRVIADFVAYASKRLEPYGTRVSTALFGLAATRDLGIGQVPRWISKSADSVSPMSYPVLYGGGELGLESPSAEPGETVFRTLTDFRRQLKGSEAQLVPWIQDWDYGTEEVLAQIDAARLQGAKGYLLWNASGLYTTAALAPAGTYGG
ncbi:putative glycoside hydrolase [Gaiella sp.]|uniref:putative glycoside hydrolase n=1 Tax=Gaiella sp. TaxID=2663207 RepID=UPI003266A6CD